ncbi:hypothetical protein B0H13DRAFT_2202960, partial [Mycena leptocephala]
MSVYKIDNARHRAKRKAYMEELEETVAKLQIQTALGQFTFEQAAVLSPPLPKIRELEAENARLMRENHDLHRALSDTTETFIACPPTPPPPFDVVLCARNCDDAFPDREHKRRKIDTN